MRVPRAKGWARSASSSRDGDRVRIRQGVQRPIAYATDTITRARNEAGRLKF